jgi:hypothetical protein
MRTLGTRRRAVLIAGVATVTAAALSACSAGQVAETALKNSSVYGVNTQTANGTVLIRGLAVLYDNSVGYPAGGNAPLEVNFYNQTKQAVTVLVSSQPLAGAAEGQGVVSARSVSLVGGDPTTPSTSIPEPPPGTRPAATKDSETPDNVSPPPSAAATPEPSVPSAGSGSTRPGRIEIGPLNSVAFQPGDPTSLQAIGLTDALKPGMSLNLVFEFSDGSAPLTVQAPMAIPLSPASRAPGSEAENHEPE